MQQIIKSHEAVKLRLLVASVRDPNELAHLSALVRAWAGYGASRGCEARRAGAFWAPTLLHGVRDCVQGCDTFTISPAVATSMFNVMNTMTAAADFEAAAERNAS